MKSIIFFRHAKADWGPEYGHDHERPLKKRGVKAAGQMGRYLAETEQLPQSIICSTAVRARTTLDHAREKGEWGEIPTRLTDDLYEASVSDVIREIRNEPDTTDLLLLVGHEPTFSEMVSRLIGGGDTRMRTAAMARVDFELPRWSDVDFGQGELRWLVNPKELP